ncbi:MAG: hypothetical protein AAB677_00165 [Patescibacteria group bacterium]|mgnify:CR=1 FL=1
MKTRLPFEQKSDLKEIGEHVKKFMRDKPELREAGQKVLSAIHNYEHCDDSHGFHFGHRLKQALEEFENLIDRVCAAV